MSPLYWLRVQYAELVAAVQFLSIVPLPSPLQYNEIDNDDLKAPHLVLGSGYFSLVGLLLGLLLSLLLLLESALPHLALAALLVVALVIVTGGLHLDGLMDSCDGLLGGRTRERRLEIMRDSRVGSFGVLGGMSALLLKFALFASLEPHTIFVALLIALPCARWAMVLALRVFPSARAEGLGASFQRTVTPTHLAMSGGMAALVSLVAGHLAGMLAWGMTTLLTLALGSWITRRIGGLTGDTYGAIAEVTEVVILLLIVLLRSWC